MERPCLVVARRRISPGGARCRLAAVPAHLLAAVLVMQAGLAPAAAPDSELKLITVKKIWDAAPHNAFTDLIRFQDRWYCAFREGQGHVSPDGKLRVIASDDGENWESVALLEHPQGDLRDAKLSITPDGKLMLNGAIAWENRRDGHTHHSMVWFSDDGKNWTPPIEIGDPDFWIWSTTWQSKDVYGVAYGCGHDRKARLYRSTDGQNWKLWRPDLFPAGGYPNEASLVFGRDGNCYCLLRRDGDVTSAQIGVAKPPFKEWQWRDLGVRIGGPEMIQLEDGRMLATVRMCDGKERTSVCWIDPENGKLTEAVKLPSDGDSSYAGMVSHDGLIWISYYSSHEGRTSIYLAKVKTP